MIDKPFVLVGYSGHAFVVADAILKSGGQIYGYCETEKKELNPFQLSYLGKENDSQMLVRFKEYSFIVPIGNNRIRSDVSEKIKLITQIKTVIHPSSVIGYRVEIGEGSMVLAGCMINPLAQIGKSVICNTGSVIEHEVKIGDYAHIAPGAVLAGNVIIGNRTFVGANSVIKQGVFIGNDVTIGAGSVVIRDIPDGSIIYGNPAKIRL